MNCFAIASLVINVIAILAAPIIAVWVGQRLQDRAEKRKDKMAVFKAIMTDRYGWSRETVLALNSIPIVFSDDKPVRDSWKEYYRLLCIQEPNLMELKQRNEALYSLLGEMAKVLGYERSINWNDIQNPYIPKGMADSFDNATAIQGLMALILQNMAASVPNGQATPKGESTNSEA